MTNSDPIKTPQTAWEPWDPGRDGSGAWTLIDAGHLHRRAGFGANWEQLQAAARTGPGVAVERLLRPEADIDAFTRQQDSYESAGGNAQESGALRAWWLRRMIETPHPLQEKMTLFWHGFFGVSVERAQDAGIVLQHVRTLRRHALGRFDEMLREVLAQPALYSANGAARNPKAKPSLTFARRLLENFTIGTEEFSEREISEVARAFTGWTVRRGELVFVERDHDPGEKTVRGTTGPLDRDAVVSILLEQPALARHVVRRMYRFFVSEEDDPGDRLLQPLVESFARDYDISRVLEKIFRSRVFFSQTAYRRCVKSPVEFAVGLLRSLESGVPGMQLGGELAALGQDLYQPPTFKGWHGGRAWINPATMVGRANLAFAILTGTGAYKEKLALGDLARRHGFVTLKRGSVFLADLLLQGDVSDPVREKMAEILAGRSSSDLGERMKQVAYMIATLPEFQLS